MYAGARQTGPWCDGACAGTAQRAAWPWPRGRCTARTGLACAATCCTCVLLTISCPPRAPILKTSRCRRHRCCRAQWIRCIAHPDACGWLCSRRSMPSLRAPDAGCSGDVQAGDAAGPAAFRQSAASSRGKAAVQAKTAMGRVTLPHRRGGEWSARTGSYHFIARVEYGSDPGAGLVPAVQQ